MGKTILAIDDNLDLLQSLEMLLTGEGYEVEILQDPEKAEDFVDKVHPDLLIMENAIQNNLELHSLDNHFKLMANFHKLALFAY